MRSQAYFVPILPPMADPPSKWGEDKSLPSSRGKDRMGVLLLGVVLVYLVLPAQQLFGGIADVGLDAVPQSGVDGFVNGGH